MAKLGSSYMGIELRNPIIAGASPLTSRLETLKKLEEAGASAVVTSSLFEEQIQLERHRFEEAAARYDNVGAEMTSTFPKGEHAGPEEHLMWVRKAKEALGIPVIGSLNAVDPETWTRYAKEMAQTGVDALELNFYARPTNLDRRGDEIEKEQLSVLRQIVGSVSIPVSAKLSVYYTNPLQFAREVARAGVKGLVLFNRFFQPDIDVGKEQHVTPLNLSESRDARLPLRFAGMLFGRIEADICSSGGIMDGADVAKMILAGASCVQCASALLKNKPAHIASMLQQLEKWMDQKRYTALADARGKLSDQNTPSPWVYARAQYVRLLMSSGA